MRAKRAWQQRAEGLVPAADDRPSPGVELALGFRPCDVVDLNAGLDPFRYRFHATRHYALRTRLNRTSLPEVAEYIGDSIETVQKVYANFLRDAPRTATAALTAGLGPIPDEPAAMAEGEE
jgi:hypothetical protein